MSERTAASEIRRAFDAWAKVIEGRVGTSSMGGLLMSYLGAWGCRLHRSVEWPEEVVRPDREAGAVGTGNVP
jgi:hypothetical protein